MKKGLFALAGAAALGFGLAMTAAPASAAPMSPAHFDKPAGDIVQVRMSKRHHRHWSRRHWRHSSRVSRVSPNGNVQMPSRPMEELSGGQLPGGPRRLHRRP